MWQLFTSCCDIVPLYSFCGIVWFKSLCDIVNVSSFTLSHNFPLLQGRPRPPSQLRLDFWVIAFLWIPKTNILHNSLLSFSYSNNKQRQLSLLIINSQKTNNMLCLCARTNHKSLRSQAIGFLSCLRKYLDEHLEKKNQYMANEDWISFPRLESELWDHDFKQVLVFIRQVLISDRARDKSRAASNWPLNFFWWQSTSLPGLDWAKSRNWKTAVVVFFVWTVVHHGGGGGWWWFIFIGGGDLVLVHYGDGLVLVANCPAVFFVSLDLLWNTADKCKDQNEQNKVEQ